MILNPGRDVRLVIDGIHDGEAVLVEGVLAFRPNKSGRPQLATRALVDGQLVTIASPADERGTGVFEARVRS